MSVKITVENLRTTKILEELSDAAFAIAATTKLPPDPDDVEDEDMNGKRSEWAKAAVIAFVEATGSDLEDAVADLIADLGHFCDRHGMKLANEIGRGEEMYRFETQNQGEQFE